MKKISSKKANSGITLVALVITIIILLILAGISISAITQTGIFEKARQAEQKSKEAQELENITLADYENNIGGTRENIEIKESEYIKSVDFSVDIEKNEITLKINTNIDDTSKILGYHYFVKDENNRNNIKAGMQESNEIKINGLTANTKYNVSVISYDTDNNYKKTESKQIQTLSAPVIEIKSASKISSVNKNVTATVEDLTNILFDGNIKHGGLYTGLLIGSGNFEINVNKKIKIYAYSNHYYDSAGSSGNTLVIQKYDGNNYQTYTTAKTNENGNKYELVTLEPGQYKLTAARPYITFDEWEYEIIE